MGTGIIEKKLAKLPDDLKLKVEGYIDALLNEVDNRKGENTNRNLNKENSVIIAASGNEDEQSARKPVFGSGKGIFGQMSDDFDEPLDELKEYN